VRLGLAEETDFYCYCARKIRDFMKTFTSNRIAIDSQGGGMAVAEALHDVDKMKHGELPLWPIIDPIKSKDTDGMSGLHVLELVNFASPDWMSDSNHGLRKESERKKIVTVSDKFYDLVHEFGGTITAEHNDGIIRTPYLGKMYNPEVLELFRQTKQIFDPQNIFNPGKKVPQNGPGSVGGTIKYLESHIASE